VSSRERRQWSGSTPRPRCRSCPCRTQASPCAAGRGEEVYDLEVGVAGGEPLTSGALPELGRDQRSDRAVSHGDHPREGTRGGRERRAQRGRKDTGCCLGIS
jgi:hypothetical protein